MLFAVYEYVIFGQRLELYQTVASASLSEPPGVTNANLKRRQFADELEVALQWIKSAGVPAVIVDASQLRSQVDISVAARRTSWSKNKTNRYQWDAD